MSTTKIFLLSPAHCGGKRASYLMNDAATFDLARRIRGAEGISLGQTFAFLSGLYFRGKLAYATHFASPPPGACGAYIITTNRGLVPPDVKITVETLRAMGCGQIDQEDLNYRRPLEKDLTRLRDIAPPDCRFILLGSVATGKYVDVMLKILGPRLLFPADFVSRGDMSRGALMLRSARDNHELTYIPAKGATRSKARPKARRKEQ